MTKPFNPLELVARVKTQLRRYTTYNSVHVQPAEASYDFSGLYIAGTVGSAAFTAGRCL